MKTPEELFASARPQLFSIAYRMLGSVMDAEDVVQEAFLRWQKAPDADVRVPQAYLTTIVTRLAINQLRSARRQRETYVGPWLPEPLVSTPDASGRVELSESLTMAFMILLERLSPVERAVFLLHEVFDFDYADIARIVDKSEANCRQLMVRARKHIGSEQPRFEADPAQVRELLERFRAATMSGDLEGLVNLMAEDVTFWADGGGKIQGGARKPVHGRTSVAKVLAQGVRRFVTADLEWRVAEINGQPGVIAYRAGRPTNAVIFDIRGGRIQNIYAIGNPDKLGRLPVLS